MTIILRWPQEAVTFPRWPAGWRPSLELVNQGDVRVEVRGPMVATGRLMTADGQPLRSAQSQPFPMPAALAIHRMDPADVVTLQLAVSLLPHELAALVPGRYQVTDVEWGVLSAPDLNIELGDN